MGAGGVTPPAHHERMTEAEWQEKVIATAHTFGWRVAHFRPAKTDRGWRTPVSADGKGFPDLVLVHPERWITVFRELKGDKGKLSPEQVEWGKWLSHTTGDYEVWRPADWPYVLSFLSNGLAVEAGARPQTVATGR